MTPMHALAGLIVVGLLANPCSAQLCCKSGPQSSFIPTQPGRRALLEANHQLRWLWCSKLARRRRSAPATGVLLRSA